MSRKKWMILYLVVAISVVVWNILTWKCRGFVDWYVTAVFPLWVNLLGRFMNFFPFSVGEWLLYGFAILIGVAFVGLFWGLYRKCRRKKLLSSGWSSFYKCFAWLFLLVAVIMTLNCFTLYHATPLSEQWFADSKEYTLEELAAVRDDVVRRVNALSKQVPRDEEGNIVYEGDMKAQAIREMQRIGEVYPKLQGFYPRPKGLWASSFFSQQKMLGYYFPFSMEANYNEEMYIMNYPATFCHELSHLKGIIYEDDANFLAFLACTTSDDIIFEYSGYLSVLNYIDNDFYKNIGKNNDIYNSHVKIEAQVRKDDVFLTEESWEKVEKKAIISTETVSKASKTFLNTTLEVNGVEDGIASYGNVVGLILSYYEQAGFFSTE